MSTLRTLRGLLPVLALAVAACDEPVAPSAVPAEATAWLNRSLHPLAGSHHALPTSDLHFLRELVGDARIVALGENTHGTRDFFEMKARILRYLVEEMGFDALLMEASWPEANRLDRYVRTGVGDPAVYLSGLYFWTWRTESVMEMIEWMRAANAGGRSVGFYGVDAQYPGMAVHNVVRFIETVDPDEVSATWAALGCLNRHANDARGVTRQPYRDATPAARAECGDSLAVMRARLEERRPAYVAAAGEDAYALALQNMRVAQQFHLMVHGEQSRDDSMAENTAWWMDRLGPDSRVVLWAHNFHVSTLAGSQGSRLREWFGDDMVVIGFSHERGEYTAVRLPVESSRGLTRLPLSPVKEDSYESFFATAEAPRFLLDLRRTGAASPTSWLAGPRPFRMIGCCYDPAAPDEFWMDLALPSTFDAVIHFRDTRPTSMLAASYPDTFDD